MKKYIIHIILVTVTIFITAFISKKHSEKITLDFSPKTHTVLTEEETLYREVQIPFTGNSFIGFREALAFKESQGKYHITSSLGYLGKYQFGKSTLNRFAIYNTHNFLKTPALQEDTFIALCSLNKWILKKDIERSVGKRINGILITESGILAAAHLGGAGNVKRFLRSNGKITFKDAYGSTIKHYLKKFSGYNTYFIKASKKPIV